MMRWWLSLNYFHFSWPFNYETNSARDTNDWMQLPSAFLVLHKCPSSVIEAAHEQSDQIVWELYTFITLGWVKGRTWSNPLPYKKFIIVLSGCNLFLDSSPALHCTCGPTKPSVKPNLIGELRVRYKLARNNC